MINIFSVDLDSELASVLTAIGKNPSIKSLNMTRSFTGMKLKHIATVMDALVGLIQKDDFPLTELILAENKLKNDIHDFINALGSNQSLQKLGKCVHIHGVYVYMSCSCMYSIRRHMYTIFYLSLCRCI